MKYPEPQQMLGLRAMGKKGLDAYGQHEEQADTAMVQNIVSSTTNLRLFRAIAWRTAVKGLQLGTTAASLEM